MRDEKKWRLALAEFEAVRGNIPNYVSEKFVNDYHAILDRMAAATEEDLDSFRIPAAELKPRVVSVQLGGYRRPGKTNYSKDNYCDSNLFQRKIDTLTRYLPHLEEAMRQSQVSDDSKDYWLMSTAQLERLASKFNIGGYADQHGHVDRNIIIDALLQRDKAMRPPKSADHHFVNYGTIANSNVQQGSHSSTAIVNAPIENEKELVALIRDSVSQLNLTTAQQQAVATDLATVELQLNSGAPKRSIVGECWSSIRNILEGLAGNMVAAALLKELAKLGQ
jgi:hypothetical protein